MKKAGWIVFGIGFILLIPVYSFVRIMHWPLEFLYVFPGGLVLVGILFLLVGYNSKK